MSGAEMIAAERQRQIEQEGWSAGHDKIEHDSGELAAAAICYALHPFSDERRGGDFRVPAGSVVPVGWPWEPEWWKPTPKDRVRELVKAGALIAAEIDRRLVAEPTGEPE
jgi:hypothetical protein